MVVSETLAGLATMAIDRKGMPGGAGARLMLRKIVEGH
jgi:hypothetical protein